VEQEETEGWFTIKLRNTGKSTAVISYVSTSLTGKFDGKCKIAIKDGEAYDEKSEIPAGMDQSISEGFTVSRDCRGTPSLRLSISTFIAYRAPGSNQSHFLTFHADPTLALDHNLPLAVPVKPW
jgi:hypothetical protein